MQLDRTQQRIIGVLIEKELTTPDIYPLTLNALVIGCNQKNNRDPEMALETFEVEGALLALREKEWVVRREGGRASKHRHCIEDRLGLDARQKAVMAELLLRGPQAAGALKPRVARMGFEGGPDEILAVLEELRTQVPPLVELLPMRPRERDQRWAHLLGPRDETLPETSAASASPPRRAMPATAPTAELAARVARLEAEVAELRDELSRLREASGEA